MAEERPPIVIMIKKSSQKKESSPKKMGVSMVLMIAPTQEIKINTDKSGDCCPYCNKGKLYKSEERKQIQFVADAPIEVKRYVREALRCNGRGYSRTSARFCKMD